MGQTDQQHTSLYSKCVCESVFQHRNSADPAESKPCFLNLDKYTHRDTNIGNENRSSSSSSREHNDTDL